MFRKMIQQRLEKYVKQYFAKHPEVKLVVVTGSVGKTSTKRAIATILSKQYRVRMQEGNRSSGVEVPLGILGIDIPEHARNPLAWLTVLKAARQRVQAQTDVDVIIQELGSDKPGDIATYRSFIKPTLAVVTAVTPSRMEVFQTVDAVAAEELSVNDFSDFTLINSDDIDSRYAQFATNADFSTYGVSTMAEHRLERGDFSLEDGYQAKVFAPEFPEPFDVRAHVVGEHSLRPIAGAIGVAGILGATPANIVAGVADIRPAPGRMNPIRGIGGTTIIDDTYNSSPASAEAALRALYEVFASAPERIAVLGDMRGLGAESQAAHSALGALCDGSLLSWVVTVGSDMEKYLAPAARQRGCQVKVCKNAIEAGQFVRSVSEAGAVILLKGSEGVYLEECVKILCNMSEDQSLVRQSADWLATKDKYFQEHS